MEIELFKKTYTPTMMRIVKRFSESEATSISRIILNGNHHQLGEIKRQIEQLAEARMLLEEYEACDICFETDCTSDHK